MLSCLVLAIHDLNMAELFQSPKCSQLYTRTGFILLLEGSHGKLRQVLH